MSTTKRFNYLKKIFFNFEKLIMLMTTCLFGMSAITVHVTGKFKGKARRTNLMYFTKTISNFTPRYINKSICSYTNDYALTSTGSFGIKV